MVTGCSQSTSSSLQRSQPEGASALRGIYAKGYWDLKPEYDVTADGQRFVMVKSVEDTLRSARINVVVNWLEELKQRVPPR
jgi:hypothetical protein